MKTVLLITGWATPREIWSPVCSILSDEFNIKIITAAEIIESERKIWDQFANERMIIVGWSMGGMLIIEALAEGILKSDGLLLISSCAKMESSNGLLERSLKKMQKQFEVDSSRVISEFWTRSGIDTFHYFAESISTLSQGLEYLAETDLTQALKILQVDTTVMHGTADQIIPLELGEKLAEQLTSSKFVQINRAGHALPLTSPELIAAEIRSLAKDQLGFSNSARTYDQFAEPQRAIGENLISLASPWIADQRNAIDIGCGTGFMVESLNKRFPQLQLTGLDNAPGMIEICRKRFLNRENENRENIEFLIGNAESLLPNSPWDIVISNSMLQWIDDLKSCFSDWKGGLSEDGKIIFSTLVKGSFYELEESYQHVKGEKLAVIDWKSSSQYLKVIADLGLKIFVQEERIFRFSYQSAHEALAVFKRIGAIRRKSPLSIGQMRELLAFYENNFSNDQGEVQVSYRVLSLVAGV